MLTWLLMIVLIPVALGVLSVVLDIAIKRWRRAEPDRRRAEAEALLREWTRLEQARDAEAEEAIQEAERIVRRARG